MKLTPLQYMHYLVDLNFNEEMRLTPAKERVSIYLDRLVNKYNGVKSETYWVTMLIEILSIANDLNISLIKSFELKCMTVKDVEDIKINYMSINKMFLIEKEFFSELFNMRTFYTTWKEEGGSLDPLSEGLATMILLIVQGSISIGSVETSMGLIVSTAKSTFSLYMTILRQEMSTNIFHDIKHSNLCSRDRTYETVWTWYAMRDSRPQLVEYESLYSPEHLKHLRKLSDEKPDWLDCF